MIKFLTINILFCTLFLTGCNKTKNSKLRIAVIPKGTTHEFWKSGEAGAKKAGGELGVEVIWKGPQQESDRAGQLKVVENFITFSRFSHDSGFPFFLQKWSKLYQTPSQRSRFLVKDGKDENLKDSAR